MTDADHPRFALSMQNLASVFSADMGPVKLEAYWRALQFAPIDAVRTAIDSALRECDRMPPPAQLRRYVPEQKPRWAALEPMEHRPPPAQMPTLAEMLEGTQEVRDLVQRQADEARGRLRDLPPGKERTAQVVLLSRYLGEPESAAANVLWVRREMAKHGPDHRPAIRGFVPSPEPKPATEVRNPPHWTEREPGADDLDEIPF